MDAFYLVGEPIAIVSNPIVIYWFIADKRKQVPIVWEKRQGSHCLGAHPLALGFEPKPKTCVLFFGHHGCFPKGFGIAFLASAMTTVFGV